MKINFAILVILFISLALALLFFNKKVPETKLFPESGENTALNIYSENGQSLTTINTEIADNKAERSLGLMHRKELPKDSGMLFVMDKEKEQSFWMKNTYIPLDIIFINKDLKIVDIYERAEPLSTQPIISKEKAKYVLEVNAGFADKHKIKIGDFIQ